MSSPQIPSPEWWERQLELRLENTLVATVWMGVIPPYIVNHGSFERQRELEIEMMNAHPKARKATLSIAKQPRLKVTLHICLGEVRSQKRRDFALSVCKRDNGNIGFSGGIRVRSVLKLAVFGALLLAAAPYTSTMALAQDSRTYVTQLVTYFEAFSWLPMVVSKGQKVGDVQAVGDQSLLLRASDCFPNLRAPNVDHPTLPVTLSLDSGSASLAFGLDKLFGTKLAASGVDRVTVRFTDVEVQTVYLGDLVSALAPPCETMRPYLTTGRRTSLFGKTAQVISTIVTAKRQFVFRSTSGMEISATVADIKALLGEKVAEVIPIDAKLDAEIKLGTQHGIFASSANPEIIAFQPTHILSPGSLGSSASTEPEFVPFDPGNPLHREMLKSMGELIQP